MRSSLPNYLPIRKSIFRNERLKKFENIYHTILPDFLSKLDECECLNTI